MELAVRLTARAQLALRLFSVCTPTRWRHGFDGPTGLVLSECREVARDEGIDWEWVRPVVRRLEFEFLKSREDERKAMEKKDKRKRK